MRTYAVVCFLLTATPLLSAPLAPNTTMTIPFPNLPPTFSNLADHTKTPPQMTIYLPRNYNPTRKHPLLIVLSGGTGGTASNPSVARKISQETDFVCVSLPLFKAPPPADSPPTQLADPGANQSPLPATKPKTPDAILIRNPDCKYAWPLYKQMLAKLDETIPNLDPAHQILGGFSNGAHATSGLIDEFDGQVAARFSAFFFIEGGGKLQHYDLLKGKAFLMVYGSEKSRPRSQQIYESAKAAGARATIKGMNNVGHAFPESEYPKVREWLRGPASE